MRNIHYRAQKKENEKLNIYLDLDRELKMLRNMKVTIYQLNFEPLESD